MSERCPEMKTMAAGDESMDFCELSDRPSGMKICLLESGDECDIYNEYLEDLEQARLLLGVG